MLMRSVILAAALALAACATPWGGDPAAAAGESDRGGVVDGARARQLVAEGALLLDVRTPDEFAGGHIEGALNVPFDEVEARLAEIGPATRPIVAYCRSGRRSAIAATTLRARGYVVHDLGAMSAW